MSCTEPHLQEHKKLFKRAQEILLVIIIYAVSYNFAVL